MVGYLTIGLLLCGLAAGTSAVKTNFPEFLSFNEIEPPIVSATLDMGEMPCQMDVKTVERVIGKCERRGGSEACIAGQYIIPNHHDCLMKR